MYVCICNTKQGRNKLNTGNLVHTGELTFSLELITIYKQLQKNVISHNNNLIQKLKLNNLNTKTHIITYAQATAILVLRLLNKSINKGHDTQLNTITYVVVASCYI